MSSGFDDRRTDQPGAPSPDPQPATDASQPERTDRPDSGQWKLSHIDARQQQWAPFGRKPRYMHGQGLPPAQMPQAPDLAGARAEPNPTAKTEKLRRPDGDEPGEAPADSDDALQFEKTVRFDTAAAAPEPQPEPEDKPFGEPTPVSGVTPRDAAQGASPFGAPWQPKPNDQVQWQPAGNAYPQQAQQPAQQQAQQAPQTQQPPRDGWGRPAQPAANGAPNYGAAQSDTGTTINRKALIGFGIGLLIAIALVVAVAVAKGSKSSSEPPSETTSPSLVSALTSSADAAPTTTAAPSPAVPVSDVPAVVPGFQAVVAADVGAVYDVPVGWVVSAEGRLGGPPNGIVGKGYCPGSTRTIALLTGSDAKDSGKAATELGARTAKSAYADTSGGHSGEPQPLSSLDGLQRGVFVETKGTLATSRPGCATEYSIFTFAMPSDAEEGSFVMVIAADTGVPHALDADTAKRIFTSIRPHKT